MEPIITTIEAINKTREYLDYIEEHINNVQKAWDCLKLKCSDMRFIYDDFVYFSIEHDVKCHDLSKLSEDELVQYRRVFYPCKNEIKVELKDSWEHHKKENQHHWQNWTKKNNSHPYEWEINCVHMVIDWMAMGYKFEDTAQKYYEKNKDNILIPDYAISFIYEIFKRIINDNNSI